MSEENENLEFDEEAWRAELNSPAFNHGMDIGVSLGRSEASREAQRAFDAGEIELWLAWQQPKTMEEWKAWEAEHGNLRERWSEEEE